MRSIDPDLASLAATVKAQAPDVIHFAGFDTHQASDLLGGSFKAEWDGLVLCREADLEPEAVYSEPLAKALNSAESQKPRLVGINTYDSAVRISALIVAGGTEAAVGFQDVIDDELAELFFSNFYLAWRLSGRDTISAFLQVQEILKSSGQSLTGSGFVLWRSESIVGSRRADGSALRPRTPQRVVGRNLYRDGDRFGSAPRGDSLRLWHAGNGRVGRGRGHRTGPGTGLWQAKWGNLFERDPQKFPSPRDIFLYDDIKPFKRLNYSLLHNDRGLFEKFDLKRAVGVNGRIAGLKLQVAIEAGATPRPTSRLSTWSTHEPSTFTRRSAFRSPRSSSGRYEHTLKTTLTIRLMMGDETLFDETTRRPARRGRVARHRHGPDPVALVRAAGRPDRPADHRLGATLPRGAPGRPGRDSTVTRPSTRRLTTPTR